jgi:hypothetical protein
MGRTSKIAKAAGQGAKMAVKYGPQAKIVWDKGGKQAASAATKRALSLNNRRKAFAHAGGVIDGSVLKIAPQGSTVYVVFTGDLPIASYPSQELPFPILLQHADLDRRVRPEDGRRSIPRIRHKESRPRQLR